MAEKRKYTDLKKFLGGWADPSLTGVYGQPLSLDFFKPSKDLTPLPSSSEPTPSSSEAQEAEEDEEPEAKKNKLPPPPPLPKVSAPYALTKEILELPLPPPALPPKPSTLKSKTIILPYKATLPIKAGRGPLPPTPSPKTVTGKLVDLTPTPEEKLKYLEELIYGVEGGKTPEKSADTSDLMKRLTELVKTGQKQQNSPGTAELEITPIKFNLSEVVLDEAFSPSTNPLTPPGNQPLLNQIKSFNKSVLTPTETLKSKPLAQKQVEDKIDKAFAKKIIDKERLDAELKKRYQVAYGADEEQDWGEEEDFDKNLQEKLDALKEKGPISEEVATISKIADPNEKPLVPGVNIDDTVQMIQKGELKSDQLVTLDWNNLQKVAAKLGQTEIGKEMKIKGTLKKETILNKIREYQNALNEKKK
jgi:hypothetical protein